MNITSMTLKQMQAATKAQIIADIAKQLDKATKRELIMFALGLGETVTETAMTHRADGQVSAVETVERDIETNAVVKTTRLEYDHYEDEPGRPVKDIVTRVLNPLGAETSRVTLRHYTTAKQPEVVPNAVEVPIGV